MKRAIDLGMVDAAAIKTPGGKIRLRLLLSADQLEAMLMAARSNDPPEEEVQRSATPRNAREDENRIEDDEDDASARADAPDSVQRVAPTAPVGRVEEKFVIEGTRAWKAWLSAGHPPSLSVRRRMEDGKVRSGWHFPSLFPQIADSSDTGAR